MFLWYYRRFSSM